MFGEPFTYRVVGQEWTYDGEKESGDALAGTLTKISESPSPSDPTGEALAKRLVDRYGGEIVTVELEEGVPVGGEKVY